MSENTAGDPAEYKEIIEKICALKKQKNAVILAHSYCLPEVQDIADFVGDSLGLSQTAAKTDADIIVFAGVRFMAESAAILSPDKKVLMPAPDAGCPMADMITAEQLRAEKAKYPGARVVCYVNSSAAVKAESDVCCTSSNALEVVSGIDADEILFVPDRNLGAYVAQHTGKTIRLWNGYCPIHDAFTADDEKEARIRCSRLTGSGEDPAQAVFLAHPECRREVLEKADRIFSTAGIINYIRNAPEQEKAFIIGTECGVLHKINAQNPEKTIIPLSEKAVCADMKKTTLPMILQALEKEEHVITVPEDIRKDAAKALDRMLEVLPQK